mmetsp:Transcript_17632/g.44929  ORF Transcript_17632/g.44929 Transcript_17632/m.44929 type:complete len:209 (-) Transcript_17632:5916-6542(-)
MLQDRLRREQGGGGTAESVYPIPVGGSSIVGVWGYIQACEEMITQFDQMGWRPSDIVFATGSGGTAAGLCAGLHMAGCTDIKLHAVCVCDSSAYFYGHINETLEALGLDVRAEDVIDIIDGYSAPGYARTTPEDVELLASVAKEAALFLDPCYTGKAFKGMAREAQKTPSRFRGSDVLFVHTGGFFSMYDYAPQFLPFFPPSKPLLQE